MLLSSPEHPSNSALPLITAYGPWSGTTYALRAAQSSQVPALEPTGFFFETQRQRHNR